MKYRIVLLLLMLPVLCFSQTPGYYTEPYRPQFHFTPTSKWMNDPNGLVYLNGKYHLFYQYYPNDIVWGPMHWGHATSTDLLHWKHLPIALYPDSLGWIFSGSAVIDKENTAGFGKNAMVAIFTYHNDEIWKAGKKNTESQGIAYSLDEGITWTKYKGNPVLNNSGQQDFRDPKVCWNDEIKKWNMALAVGDRIKIFSSANLTSWNFESDFKPDNDEKNLGVWECPDLFRIKVKNSNEEKWVLIINHGDNAPNGGSGTRYFVGDFDGKTFTNTQPAVWMDNGTDFYAAVTYSNVPGNKRILLGWMSNWKYATKVPTKAWRSAMTLPRELELVKEHGSYFIYQEITGYFYSISKTIFHANEINASFNKKHIDLSQADITFDLEDVQDMQLQLLNDKGEKFVIELKDNQLLTDRRQSGKTGFSNVFAASPQTMQLQDEKVNSFRVILDKTSAEIILNHGRFSMTNLFFPNAPYTTLKITHPGRGKIIHLKINAVQSVWR